MIRIRISHANMAGLALLSVSLAAGATVPSLIPFQGIAKTAGGAPVAGPANITVTLYNGPAAAAAIVFGPEVHPAVPVGAGGHFAINIGSVAVGGVPNSATDPAELWLGVRIGADPEMTPRIRFTSAPYAYRVGRVSSPELDDSIDLGDATHTGLLQVFKNGQAQPSVVLDGAGSQISTFGSDGLEQIRLWGPSYGELLLHDNTDNTTTVTLSAQNNSGGALTLREQDGTTRTALAAPATGGTVAVYDAATSQTVKLDGGAGTVAAETGVNVVNTIGGATFAGLGKNGAGGGVARTYDELGNQTAILGSVGSGGGGFLNIHMNASIWPGVAIDGDDGNSGRIILNKANNASAVTIDAYDTSGGNAGSIRLKDTNGNETIRILGAESTLTGAEIQLRKADGTTSIQLDADFNGDGRIITQELQITGGADLSEQFDVKDAGTILPGMVVAIDPSQAGSLLVSNKAYDRTVAGIVSGAGGVKTGLMMGQKNTVADGQHAIALTGRVYCWADATQRSIRPGDLLTTSSTPGHAMAVSNHGRAQGAIIGKAMTSLESGKGLVLVLVTLQ